MRRTALTLSIVVLLAGLANVSLSDIPGLSDTAKSAFVAHYDGRNGVVEAGGGVSSWTPVDMDGAPIDGLIVNRAGGAAQDMITYDGTSLTFDDVDNSASGLSGTLANAATNGFTVVWLGYYESGMYNIGSGSYAYNIGPNDVSHQLEDGFIELYNGTTYRGDDITAYYDNNTVWSTVINGSSHTAYANGTDLNVPGSAVAVAANAPILIGAYSTSAPGYDFEGSISHIMIFEAALSDTDRGLVETYLLSLSLPRIPGTLIYGK